MKIRFFHYLSSSIEFFQPNIKSMNKTFRLVLGLLAAIILMPAAIRAQEQNPLMQQLPLDETVRYGVLPNGLTYYVRHNEYPKGQADFYIAQKVGSILEEDNQRGLAHFLEHMCFNGTENFPGNDLISYLETIGVKFGQNLNAYTSVDETVYNISNVPVARTGVQDSVLMILHDWADGLTLDPEEIDKERGVIHQEWRRTNVGQMRILEQLLPVIYPGSKYGYRLPIGTMEVVDNFPPQALRDYYEKWYRPDQQGIIVVGDIDVDYIENKIKELFSPIRMPENPAPREYFPVPDHDGTIYAIGSDPEQTVALVELMFLSDPATREEKNTMMYYVQEYVQQIAAMMLNQRLNDMSLSPDCVFAGASMSFGNYLLASTKDAMTLYGVAKGNDVVPVLETIYRELLRAASTGFTATEYDRARADYESSLDNFYNNRATRKNDSYVREYVKNFTEGEAAPGIEIDYQISKQIAQMVPVEAINEMMKEAVTKDNRVVLVMMPQKEGYTNPTEQQLADVMAQVEGETLEAFVDNVKDEPLIASLPAPGSITSEKALPQWGATEWTLSNGVKVIYKQTKFKDDQILMAAIANGGSSTVSDDYAKSIILLSNAGDNLLSSGTYNTSDLQKYLSGKNVSLSVDIHAYTRDINGSTTPKDLPSLLELTYAIMTNPAIDATEYEATISGLKGVLANMESNPQYVFQNKIYEALFSSPRVRALSVDVLDGASREQMLEIYKSQFANAADYTFVFVGNVDPAALRPLVEQYIATLPSDPATAMSGMPAFRNDLMEKGGKGVDSYNMAMETPQTWVYIEEWANVPYTLKNKLMSSIVGQILTNRLLESVREREGAVYSIGASGNMTRVSPQNTSIVSAFPMTPEKRDLVLGIIESEFNNMGNEIKPEELQKIQEFMAKSHKEDLEQNNFWVGAIGGTVRNGVDLSQQYIDTLNAITTADVADFVKAVNSQGNYRVVLLEPAAAE